MPDERFFVDHLFLENYRGFAARLFFRLHPRLSVFVGVNGCGKTSLLEALARLLSSLSAQLEGGGTKLELKPADVGRFAEKSSIEFLVSDGRESTGWRFVSGIGEPSEYNAGEEDFDPNENALMKRLFGAKDDRAAILPVYEFIHSSSTRMPVTLSAFEHKHPRLVAYRGCLDSEAHQFSELERWFEQEENLENEQRIRKGKLDLQVRSLRAVRGAVEVFLSHLHDSRLSGLKVVRFRGADPLTPAHGELAIDKDGHQLMLSQLSDGERRLVLLVADIARRMTILNPGMSEPLRTPGVILIDEIELHLHPLWQRTVIAALQAAFPNVQLVLTTHSPQVLASVPDECVFLLKDGTVLPGHPRVKGRDSNTILEAVMDASARPTEVQAKLDALYDLIDRAPADARAKLTELEAELGHDEPELVRARAMMEFVGVAD